MNRLPILIGCEESQVLTRTFRAFGYEAFSCDLVETRGNPNWHYQGDIITVIQERKWGMIILHPDCTALALSGNRWYGKNMPFHEKRIVAINWTINLWNLAKKNCDMVALENPASVIFKYLHTDVQYIQPWMFGHGETKKTGLALHGLPRLTPTKVVAGRESRIWRMAPGANRKRDRSETYLGIANAIVAQWAKYLQ